MALIRSLMNADVEEEQQERLWLRRSISFAVYTIAPGAIMAAILPLFVVWIILGAFLVVLAERWISHGLAFLVVWPLYYLATCAAFYGLAKFVTRRRRHRR